jgi:hypothetical protein
MTILTKKMAQNDDRSALIDLQNESSFKLEEGLSQ